MDIVSEFFKHKLKNYNEYFKTKAKEHNLTSFINLADLKHYDVTLNSINTNQSVMNNAGPNFSSYDKKKHLRFYIHDKSSNENYSEEQKDTNAIIFCLIKGNVTEGEKGVDIKSIRDLKYNEF